MPSTRRTRVPQAHPVHRASRYHEAHAMIQKEWLTLIERSGDTAVFTLPRRITRSVLEWITGGGGGQSSEFPRFSVCLFLSPFKTLIGPNSKDQMLFRLLIKGNRSGQGKNIVVYNFVTHETQRSRFLSFVYRHSIDFVDARRLFITSPTFFYNLLIRNTSRRWSTLTHCRV